MHNLRRVKTGRGSTTDPVLSLASDQGSVGVALSWFVISEFRLRILPMRDPNHRAWNDLGAGISYVGSGRLVLLHTSLLNSNFGPWGGGTFFRSDDDGCASVY